MENFRKEMNDRVRTELEKLGFSSACIQEIPELLESNFGGNNTIPPTDVSKLRIDPSIWIMTIGIISGFANYAGTGLLIRMIDHWQVRVHGGLHEDVVK